MFSPLGMFEARLELFCKNKGIPQSEFLKRCREATAEDEKSKLYMNILLSSVEYETFVKLMYIMKPVAERKLSMEAESKAIEDRYAGGEGKDDKNGGSPSKAGRSNSDFTEMKEIDGDAGAEAKGGADDYDDSKGASK